MSSRRKLPIPAGGGQPGLMAALPATTDSMATTQEAVYERQAIDPNRSGTNANPSPRGIPPHLRNQIAPAKHICAIPECRAKFLTESDLEDHQRLMGHWWCSECKLNFWDRDVLFAHNGTAHRQLQELVCPGCGGEHGSAGALVKHIESRQCNRLSPEMLHERRLKQIEFNRALRQLNPANAQLELIGPEAMEEMEKCLAKTSIKEDDSRPPHFKPDRRIASYMESGIRSGAKQELENYRSGYAKEPDLLTGETESPETTASSPGVEQKGDQWGTIHNPTVNANPATRWTGDLERHLDPVPSSQDTDPNGKVLDPDAPGFNAAVFYHNILEHFKCPHTRCKSKFKTAPALTGHLRKAHGKKGPEVEFKCPRCFHYFSSMTAAIQHADTATRRCCVRRTESFREFTSHITGGLLDGLNDVGDCLPDGSPRYVIPRAFLDTLPWPAHPRSLAQIERAEKEGVGRGRMKEWAMNDVEDTEQNPPKIRQP